MRRSAVALSAMVASLSLTTLLSSGVVAADPSPSPTVATGLACAPLDVAVLLDTTGSMDPAIGNVKSQIADFIGTVEEESGGDYRISLVDFGSNVRVVAPFGERNGAAIRDALLTLEGYDSGGEGPEAWDEALVTAVDARAASQLQAEDAGQQTGDFAPWREGAKKMVVLVTDALPAGFDDASDQADFDRAYAAAVRASQAGTRIATVFVPNGNQQDDAPDGLRAIANMSQSTYTATATDGSNLADGLTLIVDTCASDTDGDGLFDTWETEGYDADGDGQVDVDLPAMGAKVDHKDLFIQVNWMTIDGARPCVLGIFCTAREGDPHPPDPQALTRAVDVFAKAPVPNPDGTNGITLHVDAANLGPKRNGIGSEKGFGGPMIEHVPVLFTEDSPIDQAETVLAPLERRYLPAARSAIFTWVVYAERLTAGDGLLGYAPGTPGDTVLLGDALLNSTQLEAMTLVHELGHTLGLRHGGLDDINGKPNYLSIMNYDFTLGDGLTRDGQSGVIDYSRFHLAALDETEGLDESRGVFAMDGSSPPSRYGIVYHCADGSAGPVDRREAVANAAIDWDCDGDTTDTAVVGAVHLMVSAVDSGRHLLSGRHDWESLTFTGGSRGGLESTGEQTDEQGLDYASWLATPKDYAVEVFDPGPVIVDPATQHVRLNVGIRNRGLKQDEYVLVAKDAPPVRAARPPDAVRVPPGSLVEAPVDLQLAPGWASEGPAEIEVTVTSKAAPHLGATRTIRLEPGHGTRSGSGGTLTVEPVEPTTRSAFSVVGPGFAPNAPVLVVSDADWFSPIATTADSSGTVRALVTAPAEPTSGTVSAIGAASPIPQTTSSAAAPITAEEGTDAIDGEPAPMAGEVGQSPMVLSSEVNVVAAAPTRPSRTVLVACSGLVLALVTLGFAIRHRRRHGEE